MQTVTTEMVDAESPFHIRGRLLSAQAFTSGLRQLAEALGCGSAPVFSCLDPGGIATLSNRDELLGGDTVLVATTQIPYNPQWGGYGGLPHLRGEPPGRETIAGFLAPFIHSYHTMQENIHLECSPSGQLLVSVPTPLLRQGLPCGDHRLRLVISALAEGDGREVSPPWSAPTPRLSFSAAPQLQQRVAASGETVRPESHLSIGRHLGQEAIVFEAVDEAAASDVGYAASLLPHLAEIVTAATPNLRAAEFHLRHGFAVDTAFLGGLGHRGKILYINALEIDMTAMAGGEGHLLVPWRGYLAAAADANFPETVTLTQDDLFLRLRRQDQGCPA
jgi:hypothetical protein